MDLNKIKSSESNMIESERDAMVKDSINGIAIIGVNARIGEAENLDEFWWALCNGCDLVGDLPADRWEDANNLHKLRTGNNLSEESGKAAYLNHIDQFDAGLFGIANTEADLIDPSQRLFLESSFAALEDAGYNDKTLDSSMTGVYVGFSGQGAQYSDAIVKTPENFGISISGNIKSIISSRLSYYLNLRGPAMIIDTACSSSLVALHLACSQLKAGEINMAVVGSVNISLVPRQPTKSRLGIESSSQRTKTFDDTADGTGGGEGVISIVLKPAAQAIEDRDNIYAIIKGSSINQDGASVGITAPNAAAQEDVLRGAWEDAKVDPETISYIEAHGTATNLGDPVEITGIERAFRRYTDKKQFCAVGSVKSNVGHLDSAAGLAGVVKAILMLKHKRIPPTIHFSRPNKKIDFISSPVFVNDRLIEWESGKTPRRCGISSFGLSGTNCHIILEEAPIEYKVSAPRSYKLLTISAKNKKAVETYLRKYKDYLKRNPDCDLDDFCFTSNYGRADYNCRLAFIVQEKDDVSNLQISNKDNEILFYDEHKIMDGVKGEGYISNSQKNQLTVQADGVVEKILGLTDEDDSYRKYLSELASLYVSGADINWRNFYRKEVRRSISIPTYPFNHQRHWLKLDNKSEANFGVKKSKKLHPLIDACIADSHKLHIYETRMNLDDYWELSEHRVNGKGVLPGTAFIEMTNFVCNRILHNSSFEMRDLIYLSPLVCSEDESKLVHVIITKNDSRLDIAFYSKSEGKGNIGGDWVCNAEVKVSKCDAPGERYIDINEIIRRCSETKAEVEKDVTIVNIGGTHWSNNLSHIYANEEELLLELSLSPELREEALEYSMLPSILDQAISSGNYFSKNVYIPYYFSKAHFYESLPVKFLSHIKKRHDGNGENDELATFDIMLCDENGRIIGEVENYAIKRIHQPEFYLVTERLAGNMFSDTIWIEKPMKEKPFRDAIDDDEIILILYRDDNRQLSIANELRIHYRNKAVMVEVGCECFAMRTANDYYIGYNQEDFDGLIKQVGKCKIKNIINIAGYTDYSPKSIEELRREVDLTLKTIYLLIRAILNNLIRYEIKLSLITCDGISVTGREKSINPISRAITGMGLSINDEYRNIIIRAIDYDKNINLDSLLDEISSNDNTYAVSYREDRRYVEQIRQMNYSEDIFKKPLALKDEGVYVIAGGMGGMGISFAKYLIDLNPSIKIMLLNRSYSDEDIENKDYEISEKIEKKLNIIRELRKEGKAIHIIKADISDYNSLSAVINSIKREFGNINGVINAAGVAADGFMMNKTWEQFESVLNPKIYGSWSLFELTKEDRPDFFVMCSSLASVFGSPGQIDYVAANAYLDSFAYYCKKNGIQGITIDWTGWNESGMAVDNNVDEKDSLFCFVSDIEGAVALVYSMKSEKTRILVGEINYNVYATQRERFSGKVMLPDHIEEKLLAYSDFNPDEITLDDIVITGKSMERLSEVEKKVIIIWARVLGVKDIDIHDKFFEVGGNSLLAAGFQKEIDKEYPGVMSITDIFTCSSIDKMSDFITNKMDESTEKLSIEEITNQDIENEDQEDIEELINQFANNEISFDQINGLLAEIDK